MLTDAEGNEIGKLFVGGLSQSTNDDSLRQYFSLLGEVEDCVVMMDNKTGRSRGFGYVKYRNSDSVELVLQTRPHTIDAKEVDVKQCNVNMKGKNRRSLKIFVGGISLDHDSESIRIFFEQFGKVTDVNLMMDQTKNRHRGFAFVGFDDELVVKKLINMHFVTINGKQVEVKAMEPPNFAKKLGQNLIMEVAASGRNSNLSEQSCFSASSGYDNNYCSHNTALWQSQIAPITQAGMTYSQGTPVMWTPQWLGSCGPQWPSYDPQYWTGVNWTSPPNPPCPYYQPVPTLWNPQQPIAPNWQTMPTAPHVKKPSTVPSNQWNHNQDSPQPTNWMQPETEKIATKKANLMPNSEDYWVYSNGKHELSNSNVFMQLNNTISSDPLSNIPGSGEGDYSRSSSMQDNVFPYYATRN